MCRKYSFSYFEKKYLEKLLSLYGIENFSSFEKEKKECISSLLYAYFLLERVCPLRSDCGTLCGGICCGEILSENSGMYLFPHEDEILSSAGFKIEGTDPPVLVCEGTCNRAFRPLSCRIFPYFPYIENGKASVLKDSRARGICPLLYENRRVRIKFLRALKLIAMRFSKIEPLCEEMQKSADFICEISALRKKFFGE